MAERYETGEYVAIKQMKKESLTREQLIRVRREYVTPLLPGRSRAFHFFISPLLRPMQSSLYTLFSPMLTSPICLAHSLS